MRTCSKCQETKPSSDFLKRSEDPNSYRSNCKDCIKASQKAYENSPRGKAARKKANDKWKNSEKGKLLLRSESYKIYNKNYQKKRRIEDLEYKIRHNLRTRLTKFITGRHKTGSSVDDLGCSISELKVYLESKFQPGMSWENYGKEGWHIDHIKPLSSFDLTDREEFLKACNYKNLQPLWALDNFSKGKKIHA